MAKPQDSEHGKGTDAKAKPQGDNVFELFPQGRRRKTKSRRTAHATEAELLQYREMLPKLLQIVKEYDEMKRKVDQNSFVHSHCVVAQNILKGDSP